MPIAEAWKNYMNNTSEVLPVDVEVDMIKY